MPRAASPITILDVMSNPTLLGRWFQGDSWTAWRACLAALFGLPMTPEQTAIYRRHTGRATAPTPHSIAGLREGWLIAGRRGGKTLAAALVTVYLACFRNFSAHLAPGEVGTIMLLAADRRQARTLMRYIVGLLDGVPMLASMVVHRTADSITLSNRIVIEIHTSNFRAVRGYTVVAAICDEIAFWRSEDSANPDLEILNALRPAMSTVPGALLLCISSPYSRRGALWEAYREHFGQDGDPVFVWQADTRSMNPTVSESVIAEAYQRDEAAAAAEYGAQFRRDLEDYISHEALTAVVAPGISERPPEPSRGRYVAFCDPSGGAADSMTLAIAHRDVAQVVLDVIRERRAPFDPAEVVSEFAAVLKRYGVTKVTGDRYGGEWPASRFREHGISYIVAEQTRSELYLALLPEIMSRRVLLLDHQRLLTQLSTLQRKTGPSGRDSIDHAPNGAHDDIANSAAGALVLVAASGVRPFAVAPESKILRIGEHGITLGAQARSASRGEVGGQARYVSDWYSQRRPER